MTHRTTCRVIYGDTDNMGYAYNANYLRWFEIGRTELFRDNGLPYKTIEEQGIFLPVSEMHCKFIAPIHYDDVLVIETAIDRRVRAGMKFDYTLHTEGGDGIRATGYTLHACVNSSGRVVRPPVFIRDAVARICGEPS